MGARDQFCDFRGEIRVGSGFRVGKRRCPYCRATIEITESKYATNYVLIPKHKKPKSRRAVYPPT